jgi:hypothetical protein
MLPTMCNIRNEKMNALISNGSLMSGLKNCMANTIIITMLTIPEASLLAGPLALETKSFTSI